MSDDPEQEYFSDGISEDIITALSKLRWFFVIARNSSFIYKGKAVHMKQVAEELGVGYVLEGSVRKGSDRVHITAQLNDVATGSHIWAERYDRNLADVFAVQDEITGAIVATIEPQLYAAENFHAKRKAPGSMDAWGLVMQALSHFWRVTRQDNTVAQALLEKAIAIDANYGQALGVLAASQTFGAYMGWSDMATTIPIAEHTARAAISADSEDPWAHHALGCVHLLMRRFDDSLAEFEVALSLNPNFSLTQSVYAFALALCGDWEKADEAARRALRLSPRDPFSALYYGIATMPSSSDAIMKRRCGWRARLSVFAKITPRATACLPPPPLWPARRRLPRPRSRHCAARSPNSRSHGSRTTYRSSGTPTGSTISKPSAALVWTVLASECLAQAAQMFRMWPIY